MNFEGDTNIQSIASLDYKNAIEPFGVIVGRAQQSAIKNHGASLPWLSSALSTQSSTPPFGKCSLLHSNHACEGPQLCS